MVSDAPSSTPSGLPDAELVGAASAPVELLQPVAARSAARARQAAVAVVMARLRPRCTPPPLIIRSLLLSLARRRPLVDRLHRTHAKPPDAGERLKLDAAE